MSKWDKFWRWFNPPLPDVMQAEMLKTVASNRFRPRKVWYTCYSSDDFDQIGNTALAKMAEQLFNIRGDAAVTAWMARQ